MKFVPNCQFCYIMYDISELIGHKILNPFKISNIFFNSGELMKGEPLFLPSNRGVHKSCLSWLFLVVLP